MFDNQARRHLHPQNACYQTVPNSPHLLNSTWKYSLKKPTTSVATHFTYKQSTFCRGIKASFESIQLWVVLPWSVHANSACDGVVSPSSSRTLHHLVTLVNQTGVSTWSLRTLLKKYKKKNSKKSPSNIFFICTKIPLDLAWALSNMRWLGRVMHHQLSEFSNPEIHCSLDCTC